MFTYRQDDEFFIRYVTKRRDFCCNYFSAAKGLPFLLRKGWKYGWIDAGGMTVSGLCDADQ